MSLPSAEPLRLTGLPAERLAVCVARAILASGRVVRLVAHGWSMRPFLRDGDVVEIAPASAGDLRPGDLGAYADSADEDAASITVHRFVRRAAEGLIFQGDASAQPDPPTPEAAFLGRVVARERRGRRTGFGAGWRRKSGRWILTAGPFFRAAMRVYGAMLDVWRGGPPLPLGSPLEEARDRAALALALGETPDADEARGLFGAAPLDAILETPAYQPLAASIVWHRRSQTARAAESPEGADIARRFPAEWEDAVSRFREKEDYALVLSARFEDMLRFLAGAMREAGTELLVVKGVAMAFDGVYPAPHLRLGADIDTLCRPGEERRVAEILLRAGFENAEPEYPLSYYFAYRNEVALKRNRPQWPFLEIHWGAAGHLFYHRRLPLEQLWESSRIGPWGPGLRVLSFEMELVHAIAHLTKHLRHLRPVWALDIAWLARRGADWERVEREIRRAKLMRPAWRVLRYVERRIPGTVPAGLLERLQAGGRRAAGFPVSWLETRVLHIERDGQGRWIEAFCLPTWRQRLGYLREMVFPSRLVMERLYPAAQGRGLAVFYLRRWLRLAARPKKIHRTEES